METNVSDLVKMQWIDASIALLEEVREIAAQWNGKESGVQEQRANVCDEIFNVSTKMSELVTELEELA